MSKDHRNKGIALLVFGLGLGIYGYATKDREEDARPAASMVSPSAQRYNPAEDCIYLGSGFSVMGAGFLGYHLFRRRGQHR